jgi:hypothetical protein
MMASVVPGERSETRDPYSAASLGLMVRSASKKRVSNHGDASSFETHRCAMLLRMRRREALPGTTAESVP